MRTHMLLLCVLCRVVSAESVADSCTQEARPGFCHSSDPARTVSNISVFAGSGDCEFQGSLCNYRQGCRDQAMSVWTPSIYGIQVIQQVSACVDTYSVLESSLLNMDEISCIDFMYAHELPTWLDVYLETDNSTIITLLESRENHPTGAVFSYTVFNTTAKIKFRARGGGNIRSPAAKLDYVSVGPGNCSAGPDCKFNPPDAYSRPIEIFCGWKPENWQTTGALSFRELQLRDASGIGKFVFVVRPNVMSSLTSNVMPLTGSDSPACLEFAYVVTGVNARLTVSVEPLGLSGGLITLWNVASNTFNSSTDWSFAAVAVQSSKVFKIRFGSSPATDDFAVIAIDNITYKRNKPNNCQTIPETKEEKEGENVMVVVGAVTAVLLVTVVIVIVGIVVWRRRARGGSDHLELNDAASRDIQTSSMETVDYQGIGQDTAEETDDYLVPCNALGLCNPAVNISALQLDK